VSGDLRIHPSDEERIAAEMARELEAMTMTTAVKPSDDFADRVMFAIAAEPLPQPVRAFRLALFGGHLRAAASAVGDSWRTVTSGSAPFAIRTQALALVLVVLVASVSLVGGATVGALGLLGNSGPTPQPTPSLPVPSPTESPSADPTSSASPAESPTGTPEDHSTPRPTTRPRTATPTATGTDDHGGGGGGGSGSGSGGGDNRTPEPTNTPEPAGTDDHGGGG
jgi:hypothetical protein